MRFLIFLLFITIPLSGQSQVLPGMVAGQIIDQAEDAAEKLIEKGFDRLDMSMVRAGYEARNTILAARQDFDSSLDQAASSFSAARQETLTDIIQLTTTLQGSGEELVRDVRLASNEVLSTITVLLNDGVGSIQIEPPIGKWGEKAIDVKLHGVALSQLMIESITIDGAATDFEIREQDDQKSTVRLPIGVLGESVEIREHLVRFVVRKPRWFEWLRGKEVREFGTVVVIVPRDIASITAFYSADQDVVSTTTRTETRETRRVQSSIGGFPPEIERGSWRGSYGFSVGANEELVRGSVKITPRSNDGCHGSSTRASIGSENDREFIVDVSIATDRRLGATCRMDLSVSYDVRTTETIAVERSQHVSQVQFGERVVFRETDVMDGVRNLRLAYVEVETPLFENGRKRLLPGETALWASLDVDQASGFSYLTVDFLD